MQEKISERTMMRENMCVANLHGIIDAHVHFDDAATDPVSSLQEHLQSVNADKAVLILNTLWAKEFFLRNFTRLPKQMNWHVGVLIDEAYGEQEEQLFSFLEENGIPFSIKIHPRRSGLTRDRILPLMHRIEQICHPFENLIIDGFYYGSAIESCTSLETAIAAAKNFPEKTIVYSHAGGIHVLETMVHLRDRENIVYDFSLSCNYLFGTSLRRDFVQMLKYNKSKVMFGSDYPDFTPASAAEKMMRLAAAAELSPDETASVFYRNANRWYRFPGKGE